MRAQVFVNAAAGSRESDECAAEIQRVRAACAARGLAAEVEAVEPQDVAAAVRAARADAVVIGGGDGTLSAAAAELIDGETPLGVLPLGTSTTSPGPGHPADLEEAVGVVAAGHVRRVDVGEVNGRVFLNNSSIGVYPEVVAERDEVRRRFGWPKWAALVRAGVPAFARFPVLTLQLSGDGGSTVVRTPFALIGNNRYEVAPLTLGERTRLDGGELGVYTAHGATRRGMLLRAMRAATGRLDPERDLDTLFVQELEVRAEHGASLPVALDGEVVELSAPCATACDRARCASSRPPPRLTAPAAHARVERCHGEPAAERAERRAGDHVARVMHAEPDARARDGDGDGERGAAPAAARQQPDDGRDRERPRGVAGREGGAGRQLDERAERVGPLPAGHLLERVRDGGGGDRRGHGHGRPEPRRLHAPRDHEHREAEQGEPELRARERAEQVVGQVVVPAGHGLEGALVEVAHAVNLPAAAQRQARDG